MNRWKLFLPEKQFLAIVPCVSATVVSYIGETAATRLCTYNFLGRHTSKSSSVACLSTLLGCLSDLLLRAIGKIAGVGVAGHCGCRSVVIGLWIEVIKFEFFLGFDLDVVEGKGISDTEETQVHILLVNVDVM